MKNLILGEFFGFDCLLCGMNSKQQSNLCAACQQSIPRINRACFSCGVELKTHSADSLCGPCVIKKPAYSRCIPVMSYASPVDRLIGRFKFQSDFSAGQALAELLNQSFTDHYKELNRPDLLVAVPLHRHRLQERGFNQALELTKSLHRRTGIPLLKNGLIRIKPTLAQTELTGVKLRKSNLKGAFACNRSALGAGNYHIALIDDVVTTGATISEAARALFLAGARQVDCFCVARANR